MLFENNTRSSVISTPFAAKIAAPMSEAEQLTNAHLQVWIGVEISDCLFRDHHLGSAHPIEMNCSTPFDKYTAPPVSPWALDSSTFFSVNCFAAT